MKNIYLNDHIRKNLLLKYLFDYEGLNGKLILQKFFYLLQEFGMIWFGYEFFMGFYGPFSELLEHDIDELYESGYLIKENLGKIRIRVNEEVINKSFFKEYENYFKKIQKNRVGEFKIVKLMEEGLKTTRNIELAASIIQVINRLNIHSKEGIYSILDKWKPSRFSYEEFKEVWKILRLYDFISKNDKTIDFTYYI